MSFFLHVVAHVPHYRACETTLRVRLPYLFIHSSQPDFRNLDFLIACRSLHREIWFTALNSKIRSHESTLCAFYCTWWLMSLTTLCVRLPYLFIHSSEPEFQNLDFLIPCCSLHRKLWFTTLNSKIRYHKATLWAFYCMWWIMSLTTLRVRLPYLFIHSSQPEFQNLDFFIPMYFHQKKERELQWVCSRDWNLHYPPNNFTIHNLSHVRVT